MKIRKLSFTSCDVFQQKIYLSSYISKRVQSKVVLFRLGYLCSFDLSVYTPLVFEFRTFRLLYFAW